MRSTPRTAVLTVTAVSAGLLLSACGSAEPAAVPEPPRDSSVLDLADVLTDTEERELERTIESGSDRTEAVRVAVLTEDEGGDIEDRAREVATSWGVGEAGRDNGVLVLLHPGEQEVRLEVADGAQEVLPEDATDAIVEHRMVPEFEDERWAQGLQEGTGSLYATAAGEEDPTAGSTPAWVVPVVVGSLILIGLALLGWGLAASRRRKGIARRNLAAAQREDPELELTEKQREDYVRWASHKRRADIMPVAAWLPLYAASPSSYGAAGASGTDGYSGGGSSFGGGGGFTGGGSTGSW